MDAIKRIKETINSNLNDINEFVEKSETKGNFTYNTSKGIRLSAMNIVKAAKELREVTQEHFKKTSGK